MAARPPETAAPSTSRKKPKIPGHSLRMGETGPLTKSHGPFAFGTCTATGASMKKLVLLACVAAIACGDDDGTTPPVDGGMEAGAEAGTDMQITTDMRVTFDAEPEMTVAEMGTPDGDVDMGMPDGGPDMADPDMMTGTGICGADALETVNAVLDDTVTITVDTSAATADPEALSEGCGFPDLAILRQVVVAITVPGSGVVGLTVSTDNAGTAVEDTILEARGTDCSNIETAQCFDDIAFPDNILSTASISASGGDTVFVVVTGYPSEEVVNEGVIEVTVTAESNEAPVLDTFTASSYELDAENSVFGFEFAGSDADANIEAYIVEVIDDAGDPIDINGDGVLEFRLPFPEDVDLSGTTISGAANVLAPALTAEAVSVRARLVDAVGAESDPVVATITDGVFGMEGESCAAPVICDLTLVCDEDTTTCVVPPPTVCDVAPAETVDAVAESTVNVTVDTTTAAGDREALACGGSANQAAIEITVPGTGEFRLTASTDNGGTVVPDTLIELRTACGTANPAGCNDDIGGGNLRSTGAINVTGGDTVFAIVDGFDTDDVGAIEVSIALSALAGEGDSCAAPTVCEDDLICSDAEICVTPTPPTLDALAVAVFTLSPDDVQLAFQIEGGDVDGDAAGFEFSFLNAADEVVDGPFGPFPFDEAPGTTFEIVQSLTGPPPAKGVTQVQVRIVDASGAFSSASTAALMAATFANDGDACGGLVLCDPATLACGAGGTCEAL
ncbi:MAG: hypothetical protein AAF938_15655 [Myxococcota bacterium]